FFKAETGFGVRTGPGVRRVPFPFSGGRMPLSRSFWRSLFALDSVVAVKTAPFNRYRTNDVMQELLVHDRWDQVAVLTGNDDAIIPDLVTPYRRSVHGVQRQVRARGGLLGQ